jgi:hypothetical protein
MIFIRDNRIGYMKLVLEQEKSELLKSIDVNERRVWIVR